MPLSYNHRGSGILQQLTRCVDSSLLTSDILLGGGTYQRVLGTGAFGIFCFLEQVVDLPAQPADLLKVIICRDASPGGSLPEQVPEQLEGLKTSSAGGAPQVMVRSGLRGDVPLGSALSGQNLAPSGLEGGA